jgi:Mor family transcriptional regulator
LDQNSTEKQVIDLRREGKSVREIAKCLHLSSRDVVAILKNNELREIKEKLKAKENQREEVQQTNYTKALNLFSKGCSVLEVTIKLGITSDESKKAYFDFQDLQTTDQFGKDYNQLHEYFPVLLPLCRTVMDKGLSLKEAHLALKYAKNESEAADKLRYLAKQLTMFRSVKKPTDDILPSMVDYAQRLPSEDSDGYLNVQNIAFKMFVCRMVEELGTPSEDRY